LSSPANGVDPCDRSPRWLSPDETIELPAGFDEVDRDTTAADVTTCSFVTERRASSVDDARHHLTGRRRVSGAKVRATGPAIRNGLVMTTPTRWCTPRPSAAARSPARVKLRRRRAEAGFDQAWTDRCRTRSRGRSLHASKSSGNTNPCAADDRRDCTWKSLAITGQPSAIAFDQRCRAEALVLAGEEPVPRPSFSRPLRSAGGTRPQPANSRDRWADCTTSSDAAGWHRSAPSSRFGLAPSRGQAGRSGTCGSVEDGWTRWVDEARVPSESPYIDSRSTASSVTVAQQIWFEAVGVPPLTRDGRMP